MTQKSLRPHSIFRVRPQALRGDGLQRSASNTFAVLPYDIADFPGVLFNKCFQFCNVLTSQRNAFARVQLTGNLVEILPDSQQLCVRLKQGGYFMMAVCRITVDIFLQDAAYSFGNAAAVLFRYFLQIPSFVFRQP